MDSYQVLARKWRPTKFSEVKGQEHITLTLKNAIKNNRVAHSFVFSGTRGVGKTSVARLFAKALCCQNPSSDFEPCNVCSSCKDINNSSSMDVQEIDGASNNGVDSIREIRDNIAYPPISSKYKIYIIDEVHMLSNSAFNALLKTLEEPPAHGIFIFATTEPHKIPATIISRCQRFDFKRLSLKDISETLLMIAKNEEIKIDAQVVFAIAREAKGSMRDSQSILDQLISFAGKEVTMESVKTVLGFVDRTIILGLVKNIFSSNHIEAITCLKTLFDDSYEEKKIVDTMLEIFRNILFVSYGLDKIVKAEVPDFEYNDFKELCKSYSSIDFEQYFYMLNEVAIDVNKSLYPSLLLEVGVLSLCNKPTNKNILDFLGSDAQIKNLKVVNKESDVKKKLLI